MKKKITETLKYLLRSRLVIRRYVKEVEELYAMNEEQLRERNNKRFLQILHRAYNKSPFYHSFYDEAGVDLSSIRGVQDIAKLPVLTKDMVRQYANEMLTLPKHMCVEAHTSGTTGTPLTVFETWPSLWREQAYLYCYRKRCGFVIAKDTLISLRGKLTAHEKSLWIGISKTQYLSSFCLDTETVKEYYSIIMKRKPKAIEGYPSALYALACHLEENGLKCDIPLCFTSSENILKFEKEKIERVFNGEIYDWFGTTERTIQIVEKFDHSGYFESPGYSINEYVDDGEFSTSLINKGFPMIRYRGYDIIERDKEKILQIQGRANINIFSNDGTPYGASNLTYVLKLDLPIKFAQFIQHKNGKVDFNVVPNDNTNKYLLIENIRESLQKTIDTHKILIDINLIEENDLIYTSSGKLNYIIQEGYQPTITTN